jgi:hypothetical protein
MTDADSAERSCPWCSAPAAAGATTCSACGAALAQRESLGDVRIPGLTAVDPALAAVDGRPIHLTGPSPSHRVADAAVAAVVIGGPAGLAIMGGIAAVAAAEYAGTRRPGLAAPDDLAAVGRPSEIALKALEQVEAAAADGSARADVAAETSAAGDAAAAGADAEAPAVDPWRDLPPGQ